MIKMKKHIEIKNEFQQVIKSIVNHDGTANRKRNIECAIIICTVQNNLNAIGPIEIYIIRIAVIFFSFRSIK